MYINESEFNVFRAKYSDPIKDSTPVKSRKFEILGTADFISKYQS